MSEMNFVNIYSKRFNKDFNVVLYQKGENVIVTHNSLLQIYHDLDDDIRPSFKTEIPDMRNLPGIPALFVLKGIMEKDNFSIEQYGEVLAASLQNADWIKQNFPITICWNRAFDRCFIRYMKFDFSKYNIGMLYSSEEIPLDNTAVQISDTVPAEIKPVVDTPQQISPQQAPKPRDTFPGFQHQPYQAPLQPPYSAPVMPQYPDMTQTPQMPQMPQHMDLSQIPQMPQHPDYNAAKGVSTLPFMNSNMNQQTVQPVQQAHTPSASSEKVIVRNVSFDISAGKIKVDTTSGGFYFDPMSGRWEGNTLPGITVDYNDLYKQASNLIHMDLKTYNPGMIPPIM